MIDTNILKTNGKEYVAIYSAISYTKAKSRIGAGQSVFTITKSEARKLATVFPPVVGQYWYNHVRNRKSKAHIFCLF